MKAVKIAFRGVIGGENLKILKIFIFWVFNFLDRFYTFTRAPDLFTARGSGHRSRSTHFILWPKVAGILSDFPLTANRLKCPQEWWDFSTRSKTKIGASMRDPNFWSATPGRSLALGKTRFVDPQFSIFDAISKVWNAPCIHVRVLERIFASISECWKIKNQEKCVDRLTRPSRTRCARSRRLNMQWIHGREILS